MLRVLAAGILMAGVGAAPAWAGWTPVTGFFTKGDNPLVWWDAARSPDSVSYWSPSARGPDGAVDVDIVTVYRSVKGAEPFIRGWRVHLDCETGIGRNMALSRVSAGDARLVAEAMPAWPSRRFHGQAGAYDLTAFACGGDARQDELPDLKAVLDNAVGQLGYNPPPTSGSPLPPLVISQAPRYEFAPPASKDLGPLSLIWEGGGKAVLLMDRELRRTDGGATGRAIWLSGAGEGREQQGYLIRDFRADCRARTLNLVATNYWPRVDWSNAVRGASATRPPAGEGEAALLSVACSEKPVLKTLASVSSLLAYAEEPGGDLAFVARRQVTINANAMLWARTPSEKTLARAAPADAVAPGKTVTTLVRCVVGQDYRLQNCESLGPTDLGLSAVHMSLIDQFKPERSVNGADTMGRRVDSLIEWTAEGGRIEPVLVPPSQMSWTLTPTIKALGGAYGRSEPAQATLWCRVSPARVLDRCSAIAGRGGALKRITDPDTVKAGASPDEALAAALLRLSTNFVPALRTKIGESMAGRAVMIQVAWPAE